jgi:Terminase large subunit, T4likevirus-type, N-terminal
VGAAARSASVVEHAPVVWEPQLGPQTALLSCPVFEVFFGGARGGGKTDGMLGEWVSHQDLHGEEASGLMVRRTLRDIEDTIKRSHKIYAPLGAVYSVQNKLWRFPNGAEIKFRYLDNDADADHYQGHSYTRVYVEELGQFPSPTPVMKLMGTLRSGSSVPCGFRATGNPGGAGHAWVKERYIDPAPRGYQILSTEFKNPFTGMLLRKERVFIPSRLPDNKFLGDDYIATLQLAGSEKLVRAWLLGDWEIVEGAFFEEFSSALHVMRPFGVPARWTRFRAMDWGSAKPFCVGWYTVVGEDVVVREDHTERILPRGALIKYREWYGMKNGQPNVGLKMTAEEVAAGIVQLESDEPRDIGGDTGVSYGVLDPSAFQVDGGPSIAERMSNPPNRVFFRRADNKRVSRVGAMGGWDMLRHRLKGEDGSPMIYFFSNCAHTIRTLPNLQHDSKNAEDLDTESEDHAGDETRYACMSRPYVSQASGKPPEKLFAVGPQNQVSLEDIFQANEQRHGRKKLGAGRV